MSWLNRLLKNSVEEALEVAYLRAAPKGVPVIYLIDKSEWLLDKVCFPNNECCVDVYNANGKSISDYAENFILKTRFSKLD